MLEQTRLMCFTLKQYRYAQSIRKLCRTLVQHLKELRSAFRQIPSELQFDLTIWGTSLEQ